ncbi:hypothetical protein CKO42_19205 [Lamprobacter modestohalophilus]|uniref:Probable inorganic carbon transporter subunit DabA n=1 Tax=Lamprobacter modestohalophilus TaxID=1064514 RepID=A0A9X1B5U9_9GAMM|nr:DUF2309 domain-containing protein [Lamprobacter modestohalophilus]MBK1620519.1 hypothetical protein [Lamprobacter modestohalophilus]
MTADAKHFADQLGRELTLYDAVDQLFGTRIGETLNELLIKGLMDFFDEGQSIWRMPGRRQGLFRGWSRIACRNRRLRLRGMDVGAILAETDQPEVMIDRVMRRLGIPESLWMDSFTVELSKLHGWAGFVRWRAQARHYYWQERNPADLVDYLAIRLVLALALLEDAGRRLKRELTWPALKAFAESNPRECLLRRELNAGTVLPDFAHRVEVAVERGDPARIEALYLEYERAKLAREACTRARRIQAMAERAGLSREQLLAYPDDALLQLIDGIYAFKDGEGMTWTRALEQTYIDRLLAAIGPRLGSSVRHSDSASQSAGDGDGVQALFCIDVRSERLRRQLEALGDYETFGIAGFFGIPISFIEFGKGHETALCPAVVQPSNVVVEMPLTHAEVSHSLYELAHEVVHDLKNTVLAPYVTVEAVGLLFGFDMVGKTFAPRAYNTWRQRLESQKPPLRLLIDKIGEEEAHELITHLQDEMIIRAAERHFGIKRESLTSPMIRELREVALGQRQGSTAFADRFDIEPASEAVFIRSLQAEYRVNPDQARIQLEHLAKIGFRHQRQAQLVGTALRSIGLSEGFGRTVLVVGHGSTSENNPYESALDCGACGGDQGLINARIFAAMANRREVRELLAEDGILIPDETWFVPLLHDTTTDEIQPADLDQLPAAVLTRMTRIQEDLTAAGRLCALERCRELDERNVDTPETAARRVKRHALDWTQVRPEWGLSKNASFIIGARALTRELDLDGRTFLHSYDYRLDPNGRLLEVILSGPLIVAQWINLEHYFSVVDNEGFGSGSKVFHNITGRFGVMSGNLSDLRTGLPAQTVLKGDRAYHKPMRLITVIEAPLTLVQGLLNRLYKPRELVQNGWIRLLVLDPESACMHGFEAGGWSLIEPAASTTGRATT